MAHQLTSENGSKFVLVMISVLLLCYKPIHELQLGIVLTKSVSHKPTALFIHPAS